MSRENEIRLIAYRIWEEEGCCHGHDVEHWTRAEIVWEEQQKPKRSSASTGAATSMEKRPATAAKAPREKPAARRPVNRKKTLKQPESPEPKSDSSHEAD